MNGAQLFKVPLLVLTGLTPLASIFVFAFQVTGLFKRLEKIKP